MLSKQIQTRGLVCSANGLKVFTNLDGGLLRVFVTPLGPVLPVKVVIMLDLSGILKV